MRKAKYSSGPIANEHATIYAPESIYSTVTLIALNNSKRNEVKLVVTLYELNGKKSEVTTIKRSIGPEESEMINLDVSDLDRFSVHVKGKMMGRIDKKFLVSITGKDELGSLVNIFPLHDLM